MRKKVLITGGSGLLALNWAITDKHKYDITLSYHKRKFIIEGVNLIKLDLENYQNLIFDLVKLSPDFIVNTAGLTNIENCENFPNRAIKSNIEIAKNLSKACKYLKIPFVHISTDHLFDGKKILYTEKDKSNPLNIYAKTKAKAEKEVLKNYRESLIIRTNFFCWGTDYRKSFSDFIIQNLEKNKNIYLFNDVYFTPIFTGSLIQVINSLITKKSFGIYNVSGNERISKYKFGLRLAKIFNLNSSLIKSISLTKKKKLTIRPKEMSLDNLHAVKAIGKKFNNLNQDILNLKKQRHKYESILKPFIPYGKHYIDSDDIKSVNKILEYGWLTQGPKVIEFERKIAKYVGAKYAVSTTSCTAGLHLAYTAINIKKNDNLITTPITFVSTANTALMNGAKVIFADVDKNSINISVKEIKKIVKNYKGKIKAITPVHFGGAPCEMKEIKYIADKINADVIEDAAHALGSRYKNGKRVGSCAYSLMTVFSFHPVKAIATGEGGMITTNDESIYKTLLRLRSHGINKLDDNYINKKNAFTNNKFNPWYYEMQSIGFHYRLNDIQCALGISQLMKLNKFLKKRKSISNYYDKKLSNHKKITIIQKQYRDKSSHHLYIIKVKFSKNNSRQEVMNKLLKNGIGTQVHYIPLPMHPYYSNLGFKMNDFPNAKEYYSEALSLPIYYELSKEQQDKIINCLKENI